MPVTSPRTGCHTPKKGCCLIAERDAPRSALTFSFVSVHGRLDYDIGTISSQSWSSWGGGGWGVNTSDGCESALVGSSGDAFISNNDKAAFPSVRAMGCSICLSFCQIKRKVGILYRSLKRIPLFPIVYIRIFVVVMELGSLIGSVSLSPLYGGGFLPAFLQICAVYYSACFLIHNVVNWAFRPKSIQVRLADNWSGCAKPQDRVTTTSIHTKRTFCDYICRVLVGTQAIPSISSMLWLRRATVSDGWVILRSISCSRTSPPTSGPSSGQARCHPRCHLQPGSHRDQGPGVGCS